MKKERNYLIKSVNYYKDINNENENKYSTSIESNKIKSINVNNNFIYKDINVTKQNNKLKFYEPRKKSNNSFSGDIKLSLDKNNILTNDNNCCINNDIIYKKILEDNSNNKRKESKAIKIIKYEKVNIKNKNDKIFQINKNKRNHSFLETKINSKKNILLKNERNKSNKKDNNIICMNNSLAFISEKRENLTERKLDKKNKKIILIKKLNFEIKNKIENKGYLDSNNFMNVVKENNNNKTQKKKIGNKKIPEKKIIEILKKINAGNFKKKIKEKVNNNNINNYNYNNTERNNINNRCNTDIENLNKEIEKLKDNLNINNFNDIRIEIISNKNENKKKEENKSLKSTQLKRNKYKIVKYKIINGQKDNEIIRILEIKNQNDDDDINKINKEKEIKKKKVKIKNNENIIINKQNLNKINKEGIINKEDNKNNKNLVLKTRKPGINLTKKIKKYYSFKNKTFEEINNKSNKNILNNRIKKNITNLENNNIINDKNINRQVEMNEISNKKRNNSDLTNEFFYNKTEINNNSKIIQINDNIKSFELEKIKNNDTKQNLNLTTRDETFKTYNNSKDIDNDNNQIKSCESQVISGINGPNTTYFSGFNKSELKMLNKINLDMPVNLDLCNDENKNIKEDNIKDKLEEIKINIEEITENKNRNNKTMKLKDKKYEKLENFINKFNETENEIEEGKIINFNNETPLYGRSIADIHFISNELNSNINNNENKNNEIKKVESDINKIKSNFYDDILINFEGKDDKNKKNIKSYSCNNLDFLDINDVNDMPNNDQDFIGNIELIQKNNFKLKNEMNEDKIEQSKNETIKEIETEYEFNLDEGKFCEPLQKYEEKKSFNKINPF